MAYVGGYAVLGRFLTSRSSKLRYASASALTSLWCCVARDGEEARRAGKLACLAMRLRCRVQNSGHQPTNSLMVHRNTATGSLVAC